MLMTVEVYADLEKPGTVSTALPFMVTDFTSAQVISFLPEICPNHLGLLGGLLMEHQGLSVKVSKCLCHQRV